MSPRVRTDDSEGSRATRRRTSTAVRDTAARLVRTVFSVLAVILAVGAVLVVLRDNVNEQNPIVEMITGLADAVSGPFSRDGGIFDFSGANAEAKNALVNWGIAAIVYLVLGRVVAGLIASRGRR